MNNVWRRLRAIGLILTLLGALPATLISPVAATEGCTLGYWKVSQHFDSWPAVVGTPSTLMHDVTAAGGSVQLDDAFPGMTLLQVLWQGGGGLKALGRDTVAALLNGGSTGVNFNFSRAKTIGLFNTAYESADPMLIEWTKNALSAMNESGCPIS